MHAATSRLTLLHHSSADGALVRVQLDGESGSIPSRVSATLAGEIMCLISAFLIALTLLLMDQARTHAESSKHHSSLTDAAASAVGGNESAGGGPVGTYGGTAPPQAHGAHV